MNRRARARGFTLNEVVVAFMLLSVVLVTVFEIFSRGLARAGELDDYSHGLVIAQARLASVGVEAPLAEGATAGSSDDGRYRWNVSVSRSPESGDPNRPIQGGYQLYQVESRVTWTSAAGVDRAIALATLQLAQVK
jgi:general secretion pathway protein I